MEWFYGYVTYPDGTTMCHAQGSEEEVMRSENRLRERFGDDIETIVKVWNI